LINTGPILEATVAPCEVDPGVRRAGLELSRAVHQPLAPRGVKGREFGTCHS
jgi:hypothetical protein